MTARNDVRHVRVDLAPDDHRMLRLAAALGDKAMSEFARAAVVAAATKVSSPLTATTVAAKAARRKKAAK